MSKRVLVWLLDVVVLLSLAAIAYVSLTGGAEFGLGSARVGLRSTATPVLIGCLAALVRHALGRSRPVLFAPRLTFTDLETKAAAAVRGLTGFPLDGGARVVVWITAMSVGLRLLNVWLHPGFYSGDDVEVHEMTFRRLLDMEWPIWDLRGPTFPLLFIYPAQALAWHVGLRDTASLIIVGRLVVVFWATLSLSLVYWIARRLSQDATVAALAVVLFGVSRLHLWFGASELPRPVATVFILAAFALLLRGGYRAAALGGVALAAGGVLRFAELVFLLPACLGLVYRKRFGELALVVVAAVAASTAILGLADWLYWGEAFHSLRHAFRYTLVDRLSSRGFQPFWYYVWSSGAWTTPVVLALSLAAFRTSARQAALWAWMPILVLSLLPHKEPRYMVAVLPFVCIAAAGGAVWLGRRVTAMDGARARPAALALVASIAASSVFELSSWHFRKTDDAVAIATQIALTRPTGIAAEQLWRFGGRLHWRDVAVLVELDGTSDEIVSRATGNPDVEWIILRNSVTARQVANALVAGGGWTQATGGANAYTVLRRAVQGARDDYATARPRRDATSSR